jgi:iron(II)-dependent oxidoreductase
MPSGTSARRSTPAEELRATLCARLAEARARTDEIFQIVRSEAIYDRPIPERHRLIFYLGHLEAFDWNLLRERAFGQPAFHPAFDKLFAFGIDPVDGGLPSDQPADWPRREEIENYNRRVREALDAAIARADFAGNGGVNPPLLLEVATEHRLMHAETLAYLLHQLPLDRKLARPDAPEPAAPRPSLRRIEIPAGAATLGKRRGDGFGWDNEFEEHSVEVPAFTIDAYKVTNGQFLEFLRAGGYDDRSLWAGSDWEWKTREGVRHPKFWIEREGRWMWRGMFAEIPLPLDWPVYASHAEASAYVRWKRAALPSEAQFHRAAYGRANGGESEYPWGNAAPAAQRGKHAATNSASANVDFARWDPVSVGAHPAGTSAFGVAGLVGNGWEWTSTVFGPFPGFEPFSFYPGYSAGFFDGQHYVMKGGSPRTAACMLRRSFRNWFQPHYPYVYATFRTVED